MSLAPLTNELQAGEHLAPGEMQFAFEWIMHGRATEDETADFLLALKAKGETAQEIAAAAQVMRQVMRRIEAPADTIDVCGTGGDGSGSLNISTATALVTAACGVPVAKHGNRSISSRSGSSDVLLALGVNIDASPEALTACLAEANICFLSAPQFHPAMRHVAPVRQKLKTRTVFNLLGPLCNPAGVTRQLIGVYAPDLVPTVAQALKLLGMRQAWVVHGMEGLDELSISGETKVATLCPPVPNIRHPERSEESSSVARDPSRKAQDDSLITLSTLIPEQAGLPRHPLTALAGGDAHANASALRDLLAGQHSAYRDAVLLNTAAALAVAEKTNDLKEGAAFAAQAIDNGTALKTLETLIALSHT